MTTSTRPARSGLDLEWVDPGTRPQDDLFGHVNGQWLRTHEIPDDRSQDGAFRALRDRAEADVLAIVDGAASEQGEDARKIADLYHSFMDTERIEAAGGAPLRPLLDEIAAQPRPTLILWGDLDRVLPPHHLRAARALLPHAQTHVYGGVGHMPQIERADEVARLVDAFLTRHDTDGDAPQDAAEHPTRSSAAS